MRRLRVIVAAIALVAGAAAAWVALRSGVDRTQWIVSATVVDPNDAAAECGDLPGVGQKSFSMTSDLPPGVPAGGVYWTVQGRDRANVVSECLRDLGATALKVEAKGPLTSFAPADP